MMTDFLLSKAGFTSRSEWISAKKNKPFKGTKRCKPFCVSVGSDHMTFVLIKVFGFKQLTRAPFGFPLAHLMQRADDLAGLLVHGLRAPVGVHAPQLPRHAIVLPEPQRVQAGQRQALVGPAVPGAEALHPLAARRLQAGRRQGGRERQVGPPPRVPEALVDGELPAAAREVAEEGPPPRGVAVHRRGVDERRDGVHLLPPPSPWDVGTGAHGAGRRGAMEGHAAPGPGDRGPRLGESNTRALQIVLVKGPFLNWLTLS